MASGGRPSDRPVATGIGFEERQWRDQVLTGLGWMATGASVLGTALVLSTRDALSAKVWMEAAVFFLLVAASRGRIAYFVRVWLLIVPIVLSALSVLALEGFIPTAPLALVASVIFATLLLGKRWGLGLVVFESVALLVVAVLHRTGVVTVRAGYEAFATFRPLAIARFVLVFAVESTSIVLAISYLLDRTAGLLFEKANALEQLNDEQRRAERMRRELAQQEEALRKSREVEILARLAGCVAHDFNNALLIIAANADLVLQDPGYLETGLTEIHAAVLQATSTTRQLRAFSPQAAVPPKIVALGGVVERTVQLLKRVLPSNVAVTMETASPLPILADEGQLQAMVMNLALNARDAMPDGGQLAFVVREATHEETSSAGIDARCVLLEVTDDGVGMSEETQARLFEPYFTTKGAAGTGLGLASVKALVEAAKGRIVATSAPGRGTRFRVLFPIQELEKATQAAKVPPAISTPRAGTVLLIEDDAHVRIAMSRGLGRSGFTVLEAGNGEEALTLARRYQSTIDVLVSDCVMPGMSVRQMIERFRGQFPSARVALCSGYAPEEVAPPQEMIDAFVAKPISIEALTRLVGDLVEAARSRRANAT
jgi:signal transduction histidine kinase/CheY-like chemotaxis protein